MCKQFFYLAVYLMVFVLFGCSGNSPGDSKPLSAPSNLTAIAVSSSQIDLSWNASADNAGSVRYTITRNDGTTFTSSTHSYSDTGLSPTTEYSYTVRAMDAEKNISGASNTASATTPAEASDSDSPSVPADFVAIAVSSSQINLSWSASTDNIGVVRYKIARNDGTTFTSSTHSYSDTGLSPATEYSYTVSALDDAGNQSGRSDAASARTGVVQANSILPVTADNSIVDYSSERNVNMGGTTSIRLKSYQHHLILDTDTSSVSGRKIVGATLRYAINSNELEHVTVSSIQGDWVEGTSRKFDPQEGASCFLAAEYHVDTEDIVPWSFPGSRYVDVVYGNGNSILGFSECPQKEGYYEWTVTPDIVNAIAIGASYGIAVFESSHLVSRNPTVYSRESLKPPQLVVTTEVADPAPLP